MRINKPTKSLRKTRRIGRRSIRSLTSCLVSIYSESPEWVKEIESWANTRKETQVMPQPMKRKQRRSSKKLIPVTIVWP